MLSSQSQEPVVQLPTHGLVRWGLPVRWLLGYLNSPAPHYAPAIAFNAFIAIFPITLGLVALLVITSPGKLVTREVEHIILGAFPVGTRADIGRLIFSAVQHPKTFGSLYLLAMLWSCSALFSCIGGALNALHGVTGRHVIKQRLMGLRLSPALLGTIVFLVVLETMTDKLPKTPIIGLVAAGIVLTFLIAFIYRTAPNTHVPLRQALPGAFLAALAIEAVTLAFPLYSRLSAEISTLGRGLAIALVLLGWLYLVAHILLFGAYFNNYGPARRTHPSNARSS
ncbi:MAG: YihY/virulence factor BrkB family protein [Candidatus Dormibacteraeota bacterium]|nr:YihY/virulence factor BrkB family protein [Candidatus Dormibacteraeota bacterium]